MGTSPFTAWPDADNPVRQFFEEIMARKNRELEEANKELEQMKYGLAGIKGEIAKLSIQIEEKARDREFIEAHNLEKYQAGLEQAIWYLDVFGNIVKGFPNERPAENN